MAFLSKFVADIKQGMAEFDAEHGVAERRQRDRERRRRDAADPIKTPVAANEDDKKLLEQAADEIEQLTAARDKIAAERDQALAERDKITAELAENKGILDGLADQAEKFQAERDQAQAELAENKNILDGLVEQAEQLQAERGQLLDVLKLPGLKTLLANRYASDKHSDATEAEKRELEECAKKVNIAYDLIKREARTKKSDDAT